MKLPFSIALALCLANPVAFSRNDAKRELPPVRANGSTILDQLPLRFVENRGQWDTPARFVARRGCMTARLEAGAMVMQLRQGEEPEARGLVIGLTFEGAREGVEVIGQEELAAVSNFFLGSDPERWRSNVPAFGSVLYRELYEGIDLRIYEADDWLEYDLLLAPGAELDRFSVRCEGVEALEVRPDGRLVIFTALGPLEQSPPRTWAVSPSGERLPLECEFVLLGNGRYGFHLPERKENLPVVIDPQLRWSTFLGGAGNDWPSLPNGLHVASNDEVLLTGLTASVDFPTRNALYPVPQGGFDAFVCRVKADGSDLVWSTYLGGSEGERGQAVTTDGAGRVLVSGWTTSTDFPVVNGIVTNQGSQDAFLARLDAGGTNLQWSSYLGGTGDETAGGLLPDGPGGSTEAFLVTGGTFSANLGTAGVIQQNLAGARDGYVCRIDTNLPATGQIVWWTYLGGATGDDCGRHLRTDAPGVHVYIGGDTGSTDFPVVNACQGTYGGGVRDHFVARIDPAGTSLQWATYVGGSGQESPNGMDVDSTGLVAVAGWTQSSDYPVTANAYDQTLDGSSDAYVTCLDPGEPPTSQLLWSTYFGGSLQDGANSVALGGRGEILITGATDSADFPATPDAYDPTYGGDWDAILACFDRTLIGAQQLRYCTFLGAPGGEASFLVEPRSDGSLVLGGWTRSGAFPTTAGAFDTSHNGNQDVFLTCLDLPTRAYCFGNGCPCGNDDPQAGCASSTGAGASLVPVGSASVAADDLAFLGRNLLPGQAALLFVAKNALGGPGDFFGDGLRCAGGGLVRLGVRIPDASGVAAWGPGLAAKGAWSGGNVRRFQAWYRDPVGSPCSNGFNTSHAVEVEFTP